ncbi:MAG: hypothetical protein KC492_28100 [Myxococcales bacterium]|nr:hypothetical protein [Myxococcales bacterium]
MTHASLRFLGQFAPWLSLALVAAACGNSSGTSAGQNGGASGSAGSGGAAGAAGGGAAGGGAAGEAGNGGAAGACPGCPANCPDGSWSPEEATPCKPWSTCAEGEVELYAPTMHGDRVCALVEFATQFGGDASDEPRFLAVNPDGSSCVAGSQLGGSSGATAFVRKFDAQGAELWNHETDVDQPQIFALAVDAAGDCISLGATKPTTSSGEWFVHKHAADGTVAWSATGPSSARTPRQVGVDPSGNVIAAFLTRAPDQEMVASAIEIKRFDASGVAVDTRTVSPESADNTFVQFVDGDVMVVRSGSSGVSGWRFASDGSEVWSKQYASSEISSASDAASAPSGDVVLKGTRPDSAGNAGPSVFVLDPGGNIKRTVDLGFPLSTPRLAADGTLWLQKDLHLISYDESGQASRDIYLGPAQYITDFAPAPDALLVLGVTEDPIKGQTPLGDKDGTLVKLRLK